MACPTLQVVPADAGRDQRLFDPLIVGLEDLAPGVQPIRPGLVAVKAQGPARYYGGEMAAATRLIAGLAELGAADSRIGLADGVFAAEQAAYAAQPIMVVPVGESASFLAPLPISRLGNDELAQLLTRLGMTRLGDFAQLDRASVRERFGGLGLYLCDLAAGRDGRRVVPRVPPVDLARQIGFDQPLDRSDQVGFSLRRTAEDFIAGLGAERLVCTELRVVITAERGEVAERVWLHPTAFSAAGVVDRVRWQLEAAAGSVITSGVVKVRLEPVAVDAAWRHEPGLFGPASDERIHHALSRLQAMLGHEGVVTAAIGGGRWLAERQVFVPWGDRAVPPQPLDRPWPGQLPAPLPSVVFPVPRPVSVLSAGGAVVNIDERGTLSARPALLVDDYNRRRITAWAGPWPIDERGWDTQRHRRACRFQAVDSGQDAWLLVLDDGGSWWAEGRYD